MQCCRMLVAALFGLAMLLNSTAKSAVTQTISYQGRLTDAVGDPVPDVALLVKFTIYDAPAAGTALWNSGFQPITPADGLFTYPLGSNVTLPDNLFTDTVRYLSITVGTDPELTPRERFRTVPYAYQALRADTSGIAATVFDNSITAAKLAVNSVGSSNIVTNGVGPDEIAPNSVGNSEMMDNAIGSAEVIDNSLTSVDLATSSVGSSEVADNSLSAADLGAGSVGTSEVADNSLTASDLAPGSVGSSEIATGAVGQSEIATNGVGANEIAASAVGASELANGSVVGGTGGDIADGTITAADLANNSVQAAEIASGAVGQSEIATGGVASLEILDNSITTSDILNNTITGSDIAGGSVFDVDLADEPGVAQASNPGFVTITTDFLTIIDTRTINCPTSGYVLAISSFEFGFTHVNGNTSVYTIKLSNNGTTTVGSQLKNITWGALMPTAPIDMIVSLNHIFSVSAGNTTVNLVADRNAGDPNYTIDDRVLSLVFFPTAYGTVTVSPPNPPNNDGELGNDNR